MKKEPYFGEASTENEPKPRVSREIIIQEPKVLEIVDNHIYFYSEIGRSEVLTLNKSLRERYNIILADVNRWVLDKPYAIFLHINSYGGGVFHGLAAMDSILAFRKENIPIVTIVDGVCASAATFLSVVGTTRKIHRNAFMLIHQLSAGMWGKFYEFEDEMKNLELLMETIRKVYKEYTKVPVEKLDEILKHDLFFDAETCLQYGLVDEVL